MNLEELEEIKKKAKGKSETQKLFIYENYKKSESLALILSFLLPGLGQIYLGRIGRGLGFLIGAIVLALLTFGIGGFIIWIWSIIDAYNLAKKHNLILYNIIFEDTKSNREES
jgi:TM2 domain-containing membrane protein YozV